MDLISHPIMVLMKIVSIGIKQHIKRAYRLERIFIHTLKHGAITIFTLNIAKKREGLAGSFLMIIMSKVLSTALD